MKLRHILFTSHLVYQTVGSHMASSVTLYMN